MLTETVLREINKTKNDAEQANCQGMVFIAGVEVVRVYGFIKTMHTYTEEKHKKNLNKG